MSVVVRRSGQRGRSAHDGVVSRHALSYGAYYDPDHCAHGVLLALNEDVLQSGAGFPAHAHHDLEIVTWVVSGTLHHADATGVVTELGPGAVQRLSAGAGVVHGETCGRAGPVRYVQSWVAPAEPGTSPSYERAQLEDDALRGRLAPVASGRPGGAVRLGQPDAVLRVGRLSAGQAVRLPDAPYCWLLVLTGSTSLEGAALDGAALDGAALLLEGDGARLTGAGPLDLTCVQDAEVLVWEMHASLR